MNKHNMFAHLHKPYKRITIMKRTLIKEAISSEKSINYCANIVKRHDYENFMATLLMTRALRSPALILRAFNVEIARIQDQTTDAQTATFRLQFWKDALADIYKKENALQNVPANPVVQELYKLCCTYGLQRRHLERLITSRSNLLKSKYFRSLEDIERYAEESVSSVYYLILGVAGVTNVHADHAASHLGKAQGIVNILRSVHVSSYHKIVSFPMDTLMKYEVSQEDILRAVDSENMRTVSFEIASRAHNHLLKARSIEVPKITKQIYLPAVATENYLTRLQKCNFNVYDKLLLVSSPTLPFSLYYNRVLNRF